ncbi:hypothetical protein [Legionella geestiana]|uniref:hypothetical protein n=1 Tax=Legionella geestiana TaxID=45065 RepID=UPI000E02B49C|nr:hypothetical protein [Legionella geestiana]QBS12960.1 hypothetical protein E4T54_09535 [Legionella geestiana]STX54536.1 Uncharacterised protein [Legionella geestiana]
MAANIEDLKEKMQAVEVPIYRLSDYSLQKYVSTNIIQILKIIFSDANVPGSLLSLVPGLVGLVTIQGIENTERDELANYINNNDIDPYSVAMRSIGYLSSDIEIPAVSKTQATFFGQEENCEQHEKIQINLTIQISVPKCFNHAFDMCFTALRLPMERALSLPRDNFALFESQRKTTSLDM